MVSVLVVDLVMFFRSFFCYDFVCKTAKINAPPQYKVKIKASGKHVAYYNILLDQKADGGYFNSLLQNKI